MCLQYARAEAFPERAEQPTHPGILTPYETSLRTRWVEGERNAVGLFHEVTTRGYTGSRMTIERFLLGLRRMEQEGIKVGQTATSIELFPFPILGIDTDNGAEFINANVVAYCEREHLTFTRGRPEQKNDQCSVEEKNHSVVRHAVGHDRLVGEQASQQRGELYRALRLHVNCFQPCMKLLSEKSNGMWYGFTSFPTSVGIPNVFWKWFAAIGRWKMDSIIVAIRPFRKITPNDVWGMLPHVGCAQYHCFRAFCT